jgi:hypothetical protein
MSRSERWLAKMMKPPLPEAGSLSRPVASTLTPAGSRTTRAQPWLEIRLATLFDRKLATRQIKAAATVSETKAARYQAE